MALVLFSHVANAPSSVHVWVGYRGSTPAAQLAWTLDGKSVPASAIRPLQPVLAQPPNAVNRVFTGLYEIPVSAADRTYEITAALGVESATRDFAPLPSRIPDDDAGFKLLLVSCFDGGTDRTHVAGDTVATLKLKPHMTVFAGDQVYLDLPTAANFPDDEDWLAERFQQAYANNWFGDLPANADPRFVARGFPRLLSLAPSAFLPDDHEYWNNYPFSSPAVQNSWTFKGRMRWKRAADRAYSAFQQPAGSSNAARVVDVDPLSILLLDTRSQRDVGTDKQDPSRQKAGDLLGAQGRSAVQKWRNHLLQRAAGNQPAFGLLVAGQSVFSPPVGAFKGKLADYELPNYAADYTFLQSELEALTAAGLPVMLATGDVHWGRALQAVDFARPGASIYEVISSPTSLVANVITDPFKQLSGAIKSIFGERDPFPRHSDAEKPAERFGSRNQYAVSVASSTGNRPAVLRGNQVMMLRFRRSAGGLDVEARAYPISGDAVFDAKQQWAVNWKLRPPR
jgi:hypothetical protein